MSGGEGAAAAAALPPAAPATGSGVGSAAGSAAGGAGDTASLPSDAGDEAPMVYSGLQALVGSGMSDADAWVGRKGLQFLAEDAYPDLQLLLGLEAEAGAGTLSSIRLLSDCGPPRRPLSAPFRPGGELEVLGMLQEAAAKEPTAALDVIWGLPEEVLSVGAKRAEEEREAEARAAKEQKKAREEEARRRAEEEREAQQRAEASRWEQELRRRERRLCVKARRSEEEVRARVVRAERDARRELLADLRTGAPVPSDRGALLLLREGTRRAHVAQVRAASLREVSQREAAQRPHPRLIARARGVLLRVSRAFDSEEQAWRRSQEAAQDAARTQIVLGINNLQRRDLEMRCRSLAELRAEAAAPARERSDWAAIERTSWREHVLRGELAEEEDVCRQRTVAVAAATSPRRVRGARC